MISAARGCSAAADFFLEWSVESEEWSVESEEWRVE